jgi:anti-sigma factor RsiW
MSTGCEFHRDALVDRAAGCLDAERARWLDAHLLECPECAETLRTVRALMSAPLAVPAGLELRVLAAVRDARSPAAARSDREVRADDAGRSPRWWGWMVPLAAAAAGIAIWVSTERAGPDDGPSSPMAVFEEYEPYGTWPAYDVVVAGQPVLSELSIEELESLLLEMET